MFSKYVTSADEQVTTKNCRWPTVGPPCSTFNYYMRSETIFIDINYSGSYPALLQREYNYYGANMLIALMFVDEG